MRGQALDAQEMGKFINGLAAEGLLARSGLPSPKTSAEGDCFSRPRAHGLLTLQERPAKPGDKSLILQFVLDAAETKDGKLPEPRDTLAVFRALFNAVNPIESSRRIENFRKGWEGLDVDKAAPPENQTQPDPRTSKRR